jgi:large subunit ribosomal protein L35
MPKIKTKKAANKRFRVTKNGKVLLNKMGKRHILTKKSAKRKRKLGQPGLLKKCEIKKVLKMLPYAK